MYCHILRLVFCVELYKRANHRPAHERGDDHTPSGAAAVRIGRVLVLPTTAAQPKGVEKEEQEVQCQTHQCCCTQQQHRLQREIKNHLDLIVFSEAGNEPRTIKNTMRPLRVGSSDHNLLLYTFSRFLLLESGVTYCFRLLYFFVCEMLFQMEETPIFRRSPACLIQIYIHRLFHYTRSIMNYLDAFFFFFFNPMLLCTMKISIYSKCRSG